MAVRLLPLALLTALLLVAGPSSAGADEQVWAIFARAADASGLRNSVEAVAAVRPDASDSEAKADPSDRAMLITPEPPGEQRARIAFLRPGWGASQTLPWAARVDSKAPLKPGESKTWTGLLVWANPAYKGDGLSVTFFSREPRLPPETLQGSPLTCVVELTKAPEGYSGPRTWTLKKGEQSGRDIIYGRITLPVMQGVLADSPVGQDGKQSAGYAFRLTVKPVPPAGGRSSVE